jgi:SAM-dependent methyltransferase
MNRKQRRTAARTGQRPAVDAPANMTPDGKLAELFAAAAAEHQAGAYNEAERRYRHIIALSPGFADAHSRLGALLMARGNATEAISHMEQALALRPDIFEALGNLAQAYMFIGQPERAIGPASRALELKETPQTRALFAHCLRSVRFSTDDSRLRKLVLRALSEAWGRPRTLTGACISLLKLKRIICDWIERINASWPARLSSAELFGSSLIESLATDELLIGLLKYDFVTDIGLERLLTSVRYALLQNVDQQELPGHVLHFCCALASQCFVNEYVFSVTDAEAESALRLRASLENALAAQAPCPPLVPAVVAAYLPLHGVAKAEALLKRSWPSSVDALIAQQVKEPAEEQQIAATIPVLTEIDGEVSRLVREQYEENPYPRWVVAARPDQDSNPPSHDREQILNVLIAGCGTGLSAIEFVREARNVRVLAIDLSLASLSFAKRMAQSLGITNIEIAQADINKLGAIGRSFDFIDASGVLHHLADPWHGWRVLLSLLRPGGAMQICLYSEIGRQNVVAGRALIAERGYRPIPGDIRRCREEILAAPDGSLVKSLNQIDEFYSTSECRDLLFHVQEHRITLPQIKSFLAANNLQFTGFNVDQTTIRRFAMRFPEPSAVLDLDCWHRFEIESPNTFLGMYQFWVRKPDGAPRTPSDSRQQGFGALWDTPQSRAP